MSATDVVLQYFPRGLAKLQRHANAVYPLEAYGILLGSSSGKELLAALPVSKTGRWFEYSDRFARIDEALQIAQRVASAFDLRVVGLYHSYYGYNCESPIHDVPDGFRSSVVCVKCVEGGDLSLWPYAFYVGGKKVRAERIRCPSVPTRNPRRIHAAWLSAWGPIDYDNGYEAHEAEQRGDTPKPHSCDSTAPH